MCVPRRAARGAAPPGVFQADWYQLEDTVGGAVDHDTTLEDVRRACKGEPGHTRDRWGNRTLTYHALSQRHQSAKHRDPGEYVARRRVRIHLGVRA